MSYLERIYTCNKLQAKDYRPFIIGNIRLGWIHSSFAKVLADWPKVFSINNECIALSDQLNTYDQRSETINNIVTKLHQKGVIDTWVNETYPVLTSFESEPVMEIERAAVLYFGLLGFGVHMNGLVETDEGPHVWVATRAKNKPFYSGKLDQMVAGGQPMGISVIENLIKECDEEANIPYEIALKAQARGKIDYAMHTGRGMDVSSIFVYDLWLPDDFEPQNTDGEVDSFALIPLGEVARLTEETELYKDNCNLVNIDLLIRSGLIDSERQDFGQITQSLYTSHEAIFSNENTIHS